MVATDTLVKNHLREGNEAVTRPLRLLIIGGGAVVTEFYLPALERLGWKQGITVVDRSLETLEQLRSRFPWVDAKQGDYPHILGSADVVANHDAVIVALPNSLHLDAVTLSLRAGLPVLCEKPLALS